MRAIADRVLVIFPFEAAIYEHGGVPVEFVGHPLIDLTKPSVSRDSFLAARGLRPSATTVALLPGSRPNEVSCILPTLVAAAGLIRQAVPDVQFVVARAPRLDDALFDALRGGQAGGPGGAPAGPGWGVRGAALPRRPPARPRPRGAVLPRRARGRLRSDAGRG